MTTTLTSYEHELLDDIAKVHCGFMIICGHDQEVREQDIREVTDHVHALQRMVMAQAAARAYPDLYRLMGNPLKPQTPPTPPQHPRPHSTPATPPAEKH